MGHVLAAFALLATVTAAAQTTPAPLPVPLLRWTVRSDWIDVRRDHGARGDGRADDTAALQAGLDALSEQPGGRCTLYLPPGTYRIRRTLALHKRDGIAIIGCGRATRIVWDGPGGRADDSRMFWSEGTPRSRYVGIVWDGRGRAAVGFDHDSHSLFETEVDHRDEAFLDFTDSGFRVGHDQARPGAQAAAETTISNCLFQRCGHGISLLQFNDYDFTVAGCEFDDCGVGLYGGKGCNFYLRDSHFERSREADVVERGEHGCSVRRCTSLGSRQFIDKDSIAPLTVQDCQVAGWTSRGGAAQLAGGPVLLFDCVFSRPPGSAPPVVAGPGQALIVSCCACAGTSALLKAGAGARVVEVPAGKLRRSLQSPARRFLSGRADVPGRIFDARRDFEARGDGKSDDTVRIQACIDAARRAGKGAMAYLPSGDYVVSRGLRLTGGGYRFGGCGTHTRLLYRGAPRAGGSAAGHGTMAASRAVSSTLMVTDPRGLVVENLDITGEARPAPGEPLGCDIQQTGGPASSVRYERVWVYGMYRKEGLRGFSAWYLPAGSTVVADHLTGNLDFRESGGATVLLNSSYEGSVVTQDWAADMPPVRGLLGFQTRLATINDVGLWVRGATHLVMSDYYVEQADKLMDLRSLPEDRPGRITIGMPKSHHTRNPAIYVEGWTGRLTVGPSMPYPGGIDPMRVVVKGSRPVALVWMASQAYQVHPGFELSPSTRLTLAGNAGNSPADAVTEQGLRDIADSLDDLRRLGQLDLRLNYGPAGQGADHPRRPAGAVRGPKGRR